MKVGLIGCGAIGKKRVEHLGEHELIICADRILDRAQAIANTQANCQATTQWQDVVAHPDVDIILCATLHDSLAPIVSAALENNKHILVEKPAGKNPDELAALLKQQQHSNALVRVGFNHRYHRAFQQAKQLIDAGQLGDLMFVRAIYGHGGRIGYDQEWRAQPALSGGGELIDQGVHVIDLARWCLGDFVDIQGHAHTYYWDMPVDDNAFLNLRTATQQTAFLQVSCTEWKNQFVFEIYGKQGKLTINGLGGSYGTEKLTWYHMLPEMGPPQTTSWEYPMADNSWAVEFAEFVEDIQQQRTPSANLHDAHAALTIVDHIYRGSGYDHRS